jgi:hypothetical protein
MEAALTFRRSTPGYRGKKLNAILALTVVLMATLACQINLGGPVPPNETTFINATGAPDLESAWKGAVANAAGSGEIMVILNEAQLSAFLQERLAEQEQPLLQNPEIYLRDHAIHIYGLAERGLFKANAYVSVKPIVDTDGEIAFELIAAEFGPVPAPEVLKNTVSAILTEAFSGTVGTLATGIRITTLAISEGQMAIVGTLR